MLVIPATMQQRNARTTLGLSDERNCASSLRPTFDGWGPRL
jgi:hypothetical protein